MSKPLVCLSVLILCCCSVSPRSIGQTSATHPKSPQPKIERVSWSDALQSSFGISKDDFSSMGLSKLTTEQYGYLLKWAYLRESDARETGKKQGIESSANTRATYSCGDPWADSSVSKLSLVVMGNDKTPPAVLSGILQRLRGFSDVQIVYENKDADLVVHIMAFEN